MPSEDELMPDTYEKIDRNDENNCCKTDEDIEEMEEDEVYDEFS